ncbi:MAG: Cof-type HAD-IIB family hydrolase [Bacteroidales bacterium]|jgi:Cof subfamily protein (haloacid dehalogenase superfamily)|nr:Cof-type HAD-IIB family hydrolase [Bacteroidales bacterium]MCI1784691.1 Cof-type HAD-IIB family hydrolase [Bacteroidales bacterium]
MIKAVFFDIDGTLVDFGREEMDDDTVSALDELRESGVLLFICSGRPRSLIHNLRDYRFDGICCMNGAAAFIGDEMIYSDPINMEDAGMIAKIVEENRISAAAFLEKDVYLNFENDIYSDVKKLLHLPFIPFKPMTEVIKEPVYEFTIYMDQLTETKSFKPFLKNISFPRWNASFSDAVPANASKAAAMNFMISRFGIKRDETMAFGDGGNDISMLKAAGIGVAMGNAGEDVKEAADFVTGDSCDDGVITALRHFGLIRQA